MRDELQSRDPINSLTIQLGERITALIRSVALTALEVDEDKSEEKISNILERIGEVIKVLTIVVEQTNSIAEKAAEDAIPTVKSGQDLAQIARELKLLACETQTAIAVITEQVSKLSVVNSNDPKNHSNVTHLFNDKQKDADLDLITEALNPQVIDNKNKGLEGKEKEEYIDLAFSNVIQNIEVIEKAISVFLAQVKEAQR